MEEFFQESCTSTTAVLLLDRAGSEGKGTNGIDCIVRDIQEENVNLKKENSCKDDIIRNLSTELGHCEKLLNDVFPTLEEKERLIEEQDLRIHEQSQNIIRLQQAVMILVMAVVDQLSSATHYVYNYKWPGF